LLKSPSLDALSLLLLCVGLLVVIEDGKVPLHAGTSSGCSSPLSLKLPHVFLHSRVGLELAQSIMGR
jgi:hypothetical protein